MRSRFFVASCLLLACAAALGCSHKPKPTTAPAAAPMAPSQAESAPVAPSRWTAPVETSAAPDPLSGSLDAVNEYLRREGLLGDAYFAYDRADLTEEAREKLARNSRFLKEHQRFRLTVEGHCDERGTPEYNLALGERRAGVARDYMMSMGVAPDRLETVSYGEERPVCQQPEEACWSQNRRAHPLVTGRSDS